MAYTAPTSVTTGQLWTAALINSDVIDNITDLNARMSTATLASAGRAIDTEYLNSTNMLIAVVDLTLDANEGVRVLIGSTSPPTVTSSIPTAGATGGTIRIPVTFFVPPDFYYTVSTNAGGPVVSLWTESQLL